MDYSSLINDNIISTTPLSGGCIGSCARVKTKTCDYFIKHYSKAGVAPKEAHGINALSESRSISVPAVIKYNDHFLVLNYIPQAAKSRDFQNRLGNELARLHRKTSDTNTEFGFYEDNYIGSTEQKNTFKKSWIEFYIENRLDFQVELSGDIKVRETYNKLRKRIPDLLESSKEAPCLIHGDLWAGNVIADEKGQPVLIDPAAYRGHRELELAMTLLFGGFTEEFYRSYNETYPLKEGWRSRLDLYKLYHILNHLNLFGDSYKNQAIGLMLNYL
ncbi:MAG: fructosamine kinase family protein [Spirochaetales bacterium]|nr:fructosamine kinase family protein [Spirochaetales bacterium]